MDFSRSALLNRQALEAAQLSSALRTMTVRNTALEPVATTREGFVEGLGTIFGGGSSPELPTLQALLEQAVRIDGAWRDFVGKYPGDASILRGFEEWRSYFGAGPLDASTPFAQMVGQAALHPGGEAHRMLAKDLAEHDSKRKTLEQWAGVGGHLGNVVGGAKAVRTVAIVGGVALGAGLLYLALRKPKGRR